MAFGVEDNWANAFREIYREPPQWYTGTGRFDSVSFGHSISDMSSAAATSMASSPSSSGSGGGGSSGGGSGGGGGSGVLLADWAGVSARVDLPPPLNRSSPGS